jgi:hypothetical protein
LSSSVFDTRDIPRDVARVVALMTKFPGQWALCGGWAVDAWLGKVSREHGDVDIAIFEDDQLALRDLLPGWQMVAHDDSWDAKTPIWPNVPIPPAELWMGRHVDVPGHFHVRSADNFDFEVNLNNRIGDQWRLNREPLVTLPIDNGIRISRWGVPTVSPELAAYYKLIPVRQPNEPLPAMRPKDNADVEALLPLLLPGQRKWLFESVEKVEPDHAWLQRLKPQPAR